jgi:hypothetical protein
MSTFTPAPWFADTHGSGAFVIKGPDGAVLCTRNAWPGYATESIANGLLIAAAPDLLEALSELADLVDGILVGDYKPDSFTLQPARAALAKAGA